MIRDQWSLIFVSLENWDDIWRRNQFVCAELARRYPDLHILFVAPPRDVSNAIRTRRWDTLREKTNWHPEGLPNITVTRPLKLLPSTLAIGRWINNLMTRRHIRAAAAATAMRRPGAPGLNETPASPCLMRHPGELGFNEPDASASLKANECPEALNEAQSRRAGISLGPPQASRLINPGAPGAGTSPVSLSEARPSGSLGEKPTLWINAQDAVHLLGRMGEGQAIYDITDDWTQFTHFTDRKALLARTIAEDAELCRKSDVVIVCSKSLYESRKSLARNIHLIPNGVDAAHYRCVLDDHGPLPEACRSWPRPVFGYTGSIHSDRVDVKLLEEMVRQMKAKNMAGSIVLVGPVMLPADQRQRLEATGRVMFTGAKAYRDLPQYMRAFDACIVPHCMSAFVESLNPIKLWEYLAAGKPIVSTDVAGFRDYPDFVRIARTPADFLHECQSALTENPENSDLRRTEAAKHSWHSRVDQIVQLLTSNF